MDISTLSVGDLQKLAARIEKEIESRNKKTFLATNAQEYEVPASLDALEAQLGARFIRTHRSYLVNQRHILAYDAGAMTLTLDDESVVYLSRAGKARVKEVLAW